MLKKLYLELTDNCNLECKICYRHQWAETPLDMPKELWQKVMGEVVAEKEIEKVVLGGMGEPLVSTFFAQTVELLADREIWVTSNGILFKEKLNEQLVEKINLFVVSIDGMDSLMLQDRGVAFSELMQNIDFLNQLRRNSPQTQLDIQFVISKKNVADIYPLMDVLSTKNVRNLIISQLMPQTLEQANDILYQRYDNTEAKALFHKIRNYSFKRGMRIIFPEVELKTERKCAFVNNDATYITSRGEVVPCYRLSHQGSEVVFGRYKTLTQYSFGNVIDKTIRQIWEDKNYTAFRNRIYNHHYPSCPDCDLVEGCSLIHDVDFDCHGEAPNCADCLWARKFVFCN